MGHLHISTHQSHTIYFHLYFNARQTGRYSQYSANFLVLEDPQLSFTCFLNPTLLFKSGSTLPESTT